MVLSLRVVKDVSRFKNCMAALDGLLCGTQVRPHKHIKIMGFGLIYILSHLPILPILDPRYSFNYPSHKGRGLSLTSSDLAELRRLAD